MSKGSEGVYARQIKLGKFDKEQLAFCVFHTFETNGCVFWNELMRMGLSIQIFYEESEKLNERDRKLTKSANTFSFQMLLMFRNLRCSKPIKKSHFGKTHIF